VHAKTRTTWEHSASKRDLKGEEERKRAKNRHILDNEYPYDRSGVQDANLEKEKNPEFKPPRRTGVSG